MSDYDKFIESKAIGDKPTGFDARDIPVHLFVGLSYSYEDYYHAIQRFGRTVQPKRNTGKTE